MSVRFALVAALSISVLAPAPKAEAQQRQLVLSAFGISQDQLRRILYEPFERQCGCRVVVEVGNAADRLARLEARRENPNVDVAVFTDATALEAARKNLLEPVDVSRISNHARLFDFAKDPIGGNMGVGYTFYSTSIVYRTDRVQNLTSWADLFRPELRNRVALPAIATSQAPLTLMMIERALGGTSPAFETAIGRVAENRQGIVTFYTAAAQLAQLFQQDEIWAAPVGRFSWGALRRLGLPLAWAAPREGQTGGVNVITVVRGTRERELAHRFIDFWLSAPIQTALAAALVDSPVNRDARLDGEARELLSDGGELSGRLTLLPPADFLQHRDAWLGGWNARVAR